MKTYTFQLTGKTLWIIYDKGNYRFPLTKGFALLFTLLQYEGRQLTPYQINTIQNSNYLSQPEPSNEILNNFHNTTSYQSYLNADEKAVIDCTKRLNTVIEHLAQAQIAEDYTLINLYQEERDQLIDYIKSAKYPMAHLLCAFDKEKKRMRKALSRTINIVTCVDSHLGTFLKRSIRSKANFYYLPVDQSIKILCYLSPLGEQNISS